MSAGETMVICQICEHENEESQRFCDECGAELHPEESSAPSTGNTTSTLDQDVDLETEDGRPVTVERLLSLGRLNRYDCLLDGSHALLLEETPTAPKTIEKRCELLAPLEDLDTLWRPSAFFIHNERALAVGELPSVSTLDERIRTSGPLSDEDLEHLATALAKLLADIHEHGFLIRSLQPDRIWWDPNKDLLMVDSFERLILAESPDGEFQVVNGFSPPEAYGVGGSEMNVRSDLYTVGAILHFAASGQRTDLESRENFFSFPPVSLESDFLSGLIALLTAKQSADRPADADEFVELLESGTLPASSQAPPTPSLPAKVQTMSSSKDRASTQTCGLSPIPVDGCGYRVALESHIGCVRSVNQDACLQLRFTAIEKSQPRQAHLVAVVDGMGGEAEGDKAASLALRSIAKEVLDASLSLNDERVTAPLLPRTPRERNMLVLERALKRANRTIFDYAKRSHARRGMGCTITACIFEPDEVTLGHVGDTRAYHLRDGDLTRLTTDHSLVGRLVEMGQLTEEEARNSPQRSIIYRAMGTNPDVEVDLYYKELQPGDRLMISSDGVWEYFQGGELLEILERDESPAEIANTLIEICLQRGADDNATVAVIFAT